MWYYSVDPYQQGVWNNNILGYLTSYSHFNFYLIINNIGDNPPYVDELSIGKSFFVVIHILIVARIQSETYEYLLCWYLNLFCLPVPSKHAFVWDNFMIWRWKWWASQSHQLFILGSFLDLKNWIALTFNWHLLMVCLLPPCHPHPTPKNVVG